MRIDPFFENQPPIEFVENLKLPVHITPPPNFGKGKPCIGEIAVDGIYIAEGFPGGEELLQTAYDDFALFCKICKISGNKYPVYIKKGLIRGEESYKITVCESGCTITAEDTEGARRAIVRLEDEMTKREGAILPLGEQTRSPHIRDRITRGFFSPTNRPPKYGDELYDDIDYYPDEYLNRLAHSGTNGLWIYTSFRALVNTSYFDDDAEMIKRRREKLTRVVAKCKKYGVKVFIFAIEPLGLRNEDIPGHEDFLGADMAHSYHPICLRRERPKAYLIEAVQDLFSSIPDLGGYIDITAGERPTSCGSVATYLSCPRCSKFSRGENLAYACEVIQEGIRRAGTGARFISWTYGHRYWKDSDIKEYVEKVADDVILMQNFEDRGYNRQLDRDRPAFDYWLSYAGPSQLFEDSAKWAKDNKKQMFAKMQICTSHELATVPYIPAPGIIFDKYSRAKALNVTGVMECWYFGNYPSIMSRASGELSFTEDMSDKDAFLIEFASLLYGRTLAPAIAEAWRHFEAGYICYPTNIMFSYYGPMHDGVVWKLSLLPKNNPLSRSWLLLDTPDGDRIGESLFAGHTLDEALELSAMMKDNWQKGIAALPSDGAEECVSVAKCIGTLFDSGYNILTFYKLRGDLGRERGDSISILNKMKKLVCAEIENSRGMITLCESDKRLGYHSEAEGFKFFPEKLRNRISSLQECLTNEFTQVEQRIKDGKHPLGYYYAEGESAPRMGNGNIDGDVISISESASFRVDAIGDELKIRVYSKNKASCYAYLEFEPGMPECGVIFGEATDTNVHIESTDTFGEGVRLDSGALSHQSAVGKIGEELLTQYSQQICCEGEYNVYTLIRKIPKDKWNGKGAIRLRITVGAEKWKSSPDPVITLGKAGQICDEYAPLIPADQNY